MITFQTISFILICTNNIVFVLQRGYFVGNSGIFSNTSGTCQICNPNTQRCDEYHQLRPKPMKEGIWIDPGSGVAMFCEPSIACLKHNTVEEVLTGNCANAYKVIIPYISQQSARIK